MNKPVKAETVWKLYSFPALNIKILGIKLRSTVRVLIKANSFFSKILIQFFSFISPRLSNSTLIKINTAWFVLKEILPTHVHASLIHRRTICYTLTVTLLRNSIFAAEQYPRQMKIQGISSFGWQSYKEKCWWCLEWC